MTSEMKSLWNYWETGTSVDGGMLRLTDIDLMDWYKLAPHMVIIDCLDSETVSGRYRWRFAGTALRDFFGYEVTGKFLDQILSGRTLTKCEHAYRHIKMTGTPHFWAPKTEFPEIPGSEGEYRRLLFPLRGKTEKIEHLWGIYDFMLRNTKATAMPDLKAIRLEFTNCDPEYVREL